VTDRDAILTAARELARVTGWNQVTVEQVSERTHIPPDLILELFSTRAQLAQGIMERLVDRLPAEIADEISPRSTMRDRLYTCVAHILRTMERDKGFMRAVVESAIGDPESGALQAPLVTRYLQVVAAQIEIVREKGEISRFVVPHVAASIFWFAHLRIIRFWLSDTSEASEKTHAFADRTITQFARALGAAAVSRPQTTAVPSGG
jgi:AcrR family transcriptional regulator